MTTLIEFVCPLAQAEAAQATVEAMCKELDSLLIGRGINEQTQEVKFIVQLPRHMTRASATAHSHTLQQQASTSLRFITSDLLKISFEPSIDPQEQMSSFPLRQGEEWFPAFYHPHQVYICMSRPLMRTEQAVWLLEHKVQWKFV